MIIDKVICNVIGNNDICKLVLNQDNLKGMDIYFFIKVDLKGIIDQKLLGCCWLFIGLNVMCVKVIVWYGLGFFEFLQNYNFFWDQLEKVNFFLQGVIDICEKLMDDKMVEWFFCNLLSDGGMFIGVVDIVFKYGLVFKEVMFEMNSSENILCMVGLIVEKLCEYGL